MEHKGKGSVRERRKEKKRRKTKIRERTEAARGGKAAI